MLTEDEIKLIIGKEIVGVYSEDFEVEYILFEDDTVLEIDLPAYCGGNATVKTVLDVALQKEEIELRREWYSVRRDLFSIFGRPYVNLNSSDAMDYRSFLINKLPRIQG